MYIIYPQRRYQAGLIQDMKHFHINNEPSAQQAMAWPLVEVFASLFASSHK